MFLDDKLIQLCENTEANTPELIQQLNVDICKECDNNWKSKLSDNSTYKEVKIAMDRTFKSFDLFVITAKKSDDLKIKQLGIMFEKHNYKKQLLSHEEISKIYNY